MTEDCLTCIQPATTNRERVRYFPRQLLTADDMRTEQDYVRDKQRRHNRLVHGWGVVCGMEVIAPQQQEADSQITVCPGFVLTPGGDEIVLTEKVKVDVKTGLQSPEPCNPRWPCPPVTGNTSTSEVTSVYVAIRHIECNSRPVRVQTSGCGCDETACEYSRVRDSFEIQCLRALPDSHVKLKEFYDQWCQTWQKWVKTNTSFPLPLSSCPPCDDDPWVVLANVTLPTTAIPRIAEGMIKYDDRFPLYSANVLQVLNVCK